MEPPQTAHLYKETRLNLEPAHAGSTVAISLPSNNNGSFLSRPQAKRTILSDSYVEQDETSFARRNLATEASIYFRRIHKYPRCFLWRILDDRKVLEIRSIDLDSEKFSKEATLVLLLEFPTSIRPFGIAFAEPEERDALTVFALTTSNELYTITLHKELFVRLAATETDVKDWCKSFTPAVLSFRTPYRLVATNANELLLSLHDGGLLRLTRKAGEDGSVWRETSFSEAGWGTSLKSLLWKGSNVIRFGNTDLEASTAAAMALSPDSEYLYTVCLNHQLKTWNLKTGKVGVQTDILGDNSKDAQKNSQYFIPPSQPQLIQVVDVLGAADGDLYYVITYSPKHHQFKFWGIRDPDHTELGIRDINSETSFIPPMDELMNTNVWNLEEFHIKPGQGWRDSEIWIRARSGPNSKVFTLKFDLNAPKTDLEISWQQDWIAVDSGALTIESLKVSADYPGDHGSGSDINQPYNITNRWLDFLFFPNRFSIASLETALSIYNRIPKQATVDKKSDTNVFQKLPLKGRLSTAVAASVATSATVDYETSEIELARQWQVYFGILRDLHKRRGTALSLAYDEQQSMPWLLLADYVSPIRKCSEIEALAINSALLNFSENLPYTANSELRSGDKPGVAAFLFAAHEFRQSFPDEFQHTLRLAVAQEVLCERSESLAGRLQAFDATTSVCASATDDDVSRLQDNLEYFDGFMYLTKNVFDYVLQQLVEAERGHHVKRDVTQFGLSTLVRISHETLQLGIEILLDLLVLIVFVSLDIEPQDLPANFDGLEIFGDLIEQLKAHYLLLWLASTLRLNPSPKQRRLSGGGNELERSQSQSTPAPTAETMLETMCKDFCFAIEFPQEPQPALLTYWGRAWTFSPLQHKPVASIAADVMSALLAHNRHDLASDFEKFLPHDSWPTYLRARLYLANTDFNLAATYFKKAGFGLAEGFFDVNDTEGLLSPEEKDYFTEGLAKYYQHVLGLFERARAYSYVAEFARLALQSLAAYSRKPEDSESLKTELLSRLFNASIQTSRFEEAYSALTRYTNRMLRKQALTALITTMVAQYQSKLLLALPFATLSNDVDRILEALCQKTINIGTGPPYHKILYGWRISRNDFRGAASILYERLQRLKAGNSSKGEEIVQCYLLLINTLASVHADQQWILAEQPSEEPVVSMKSLTIGKGKPLPVPTGARKVITLEEVRQEYQGELDRQSAIEHGRFGFGAVGDEMEL